MIQTLPCQTVILQVRNTRIKIAYNKQGDPNGIPLLFLHGFGSSRLPFVHALFPLLPPFIQAFAIDFPGFGASRVVDGHNPSYSTPFLIEVIAAFADRLSLSPMHIYGMSMGGTAALCFAAHYPERTSSVSIQGAPIEKSYQGAVKLLIFMPWLGFLRIVDPHIAARWVKTLYRKSDFVRISQNFPESEEVMAEEIARIDMQAAFQYGYNLIHSDHYSCLQKISSPVFLLDGDSVEVPYLDTLEQIHNYIPHAEVHRIRNAGHLATFVAPEEIVKVTIQFILREGDLKEGFAYFQK